MSTVILYIIIAVLVITLLLFNAACKKANKKILDMQSEISSKDLIIEQCNSELEYYSNLDIDQKG